MSVRLSNPMSAVVWVAFLAPASLLGAWADRSFGAAVFVLGAATMISKPSPWDARKPSATALKFFLLLELLYAVSALYSAGFNGSQFGAAGYLELPRYVVLGAFAVYLIRHFDGRVRGALEWAMTAALYAALLFPAADPQGYVSVMTLCWLLFFSSLRLRYLHAATALAVVALGGEPRAWAAAAVVVGAALALGFHQELSRRGARFPARWAAAVAASLAASAALWARTHPAAAAALRAFPEGAALQLIRRSPIFGWGPIESAAVVGRSQYLLWILKGGILGACLIAAGMLLAGYRLLRSVRGHPRRFAGAAAFLASVALMLTAGRFLESYRLFFLTAFFMAGMSGAGR